MSETETDTDKTMEEATKLLDDLGASYEHPGFISIEQGRRHFAFGDANEDFGYDYGEITADGEIDDSKSRVAGVETFSRFACSKELAEFIRRVISKVTENDMMEEAAKLLADLNVHYRPELRLISVESGHWLFIFGAVGENFGYDYRDMNKIESDRIRGDEIPYCTSSQEMAEFIRKSVAEVVRLRDYQVQVNLARCWPL